MLLRVTNNRKFLLATIVVLIIYPFIVRFLFLSHNKVIIREENLPSQLILPNSSIFNEFIQLQFPSLRLSPSELAKPITDRQYVNKILSYNEDLFRQSSFPILWLDEQYDVRWNEVAERLILDYLTQKQFPKLHLFQNSSFDDQTILNICQKRSLFLLRQHWSGFFSRILCFIAQFGQTLYTPRIGVLQGTRFDRGRGADDDFFSQGVTRYFLPISICSAYMYEPKLKKLKDIIQYPQAPQTIARSKDLPAHGNDQKDRVLLSSEFWKMDYHHVPIRKWLFDRKESPVAYDSSIEILTNHANEHIYAPENITLGKWNQQNGPDAWSSDLLPNQGQYKLTWQDHVFGSFLRYMFALFFGSQNAPRIEYGVRILTQYWSNFLIEKYGLTTNPFDDLAGLYIRRGDKSIEDSFWAKHRRWRDLSYYVKGIVDEEKQRNRNFTSIFVMTDDDSVMKSLHNYADPKSEGTDELYARQYLRGRNILYNVLAPQTCFDPFRRIGFDQFLVSMRFLIENSVFTVGHSDSNVFRFFRQVIYAQRQLRKGIQTLTYVRNAPDSL